MTLADLINRIRDDIDHGDQLAQDLGVEQHERVDLRYDDVEALLRIAERLDDVEIIDLAEADDIVARLLIDVPVDVHADRR